MSAGPDFHKGFCLECGHRCAPSVEALEAERDELRVRLDSIGGSALVEALDAALADVAAAEAGRDQAIKERDEAREALRHAVHVATARACLIDGAEPCDEIIEEIQAVSEVWRQYLHEHGVYALLAGVPGGGQEAGRDNLGGGAAARSKGSEAC